MKRRYLLLCIICVMALVIILCMVMLNRPEPIKVQPQIISPLPTPVRSSIYLPVVANNHRQSKKCVGLSSGFSIEKMLALGTRCTYVYSPGVSDLPGIEYAGMVRYPDMITVTGSAPYFFGFNEPDLYSPTTGATPQQAAEIWPRVIAANPGKMAVSPAPSHLHPEWLAQFYQAHVARWGYAPKLDVLAIHCYGGADFCIGIVSRAISYAEQWNIPQVWVTEFAFSDAWQNKYPPNATWQSEAQRFIGWMDDQSRIGRYYWWAMMYDTDDPQQWWNYGWQTQLYDWDTGALNERGIFYQSLR